MIVRVNKACLAGAIAPAALLLAAVGVCRAGSPRLFSALKIEGAELRFVDDIPLAVLSGTPEQMGRQHAALLAVPGKAAMTFPKRFAAEVGVEALWPFMVQAGRTLLLKTPQRHQRELTAIAEAGDFGRDELAVANTLLELRRVGCSSLIVKPSRSATGGPLFGRNFDFPTLGELHKYSLVTVYRPATGRAFAAVGFPGMVGVFSGMNEAGLAVATLDVYRSADRSRKFNPEGTPLAFVFRRILEECTTVVEAERLLRSETATTWMNLAVCDRDGGAVFEITPDRVARRDDDGRLLCCTNHFRTEGMAVDRECWRYEALLGAGADRYDKAWDVEAVRQRLDAANQGELTLQTMVMEPRELALHVAFGEPPVSGKSLTRIDLAPLFAKTLANGASDASE